MKSVKLLFTSFSLFGYLFLSVFGLVVMEFSYHHDISSMRHCPFMQGQQSLCSMSVIDHINAFQKTVQGTVGELLILIVPVLIFFFALKLRPPTSAKLFYVIFRDNTITSLFSRGILHPKAP